MSGVVYESKNEAEVSAELDELLPINSCTIFVTVSNWEAEIRFSNEGSLKFIFKEFNTSSSTLSGLRCSI